MKTIIVVNDKDYLPVYDLRSGPGDTVRSGPETLGLPATSEECSLWVINHPSLAALAGPKAAKAARV